MPKWIGDPPFGSPHGHPIDFRVLGEQRIDALSEASQRTDAPEAVVDDHECGIGSSSAETQAGIIGNGKCRNVGSLGDLNERLVPKTAMMGAGIPNIRKTFKP